MHSMYFMRKEIIETDSLFFRNFLKKNSYCMKHGKNSFMIATDLFFFYCTFQIAFHEMSTSCFVFNSNFKISLSAVNIHTLIEKSILSKRGRTKFIQGDFTCHLLYISKGNAWAIHPKIYLLIVEKTGNRLR